MDDLLARAHDLVVRGEPFALATVVRAERPASARPGMKAIIRPDGTLEGWVGGSCAHPVVVREALRLLHEETPGLIGLSPPGQAGAVRAGLIYYPMTCHSGGSLEIYIEPVLPRPRLLLIGRVPLTSALATLGRLQGFAVSVADMGETAQVEAEARLSLDHVRSSITPHTYVVVATMGGYDEEALEQAVGTAAAYVGLVASRKRAEAVFAYLRGRGVAEEHLQQVKVPAGLDIGAQTPQEIALSIMAEIIQTRRGRPAAPAEVTRVEEAVDPICGMTVQVATARHSVDYQGSRFYFCSGHCQRTFEREPARYVTAGT